MAARDDPTFVYLGTTDYHFMLLKNIELLRVLYPSARILVYDWGDAEGTPSGTAFPKDVEVVNWSGRIRDTWPLMSVYNENRLIEIGKTFNSRHQAGFLRRTYKFFLKRFPHSPLAQKRIAQGLRYENMLIHKSYNMMDCSKRLAGRPFFLIDADAYLVDRIDEIFDGDPDVILPMIDPAIHKWEYNNCQGLSTGVMGFNGSGDARDAFLSEWYDAIAGNDEWLRELAAVNRLIRAKDEGFFADWGLRTVPFKGRDVKIRTVDNDVYNCYFNHQELTPNFERAKILHLAGLVHREHRFPEFIGKVEEILYRRLKAARGRAAGAAC
jgi:hypothetical protein